MINFIKEIGCVIYDGTPYINKPSVYNKMLDDNLEYDPSKCHLWFNDDIFSAFDWTQEPDVDIKTLYKLRAEQLRDQYDNIILFYSGGSDSNQMLSAFIENNIHIDEIICNVATKILKKQKVVKDITHPFGLLFEYKLAMLPTLKTLPTDIKVTKEDYSDFFLEKAKNLEWMADNENILFFPAAVFHDIMRLWYKEQFARIAARAKGKTCLLLGYDKPILRSINKIFHFTFMDSGRAFMLPVQTMNWNNCTPEMFFWSRNAPLIPVKQSHMLLNKLKNNREIKSEIEKMSDTTINNFMVKWRNRDEYKKVIYPDWDYRFQKFTKGSHDEIIDHCIGSIAGQRQEKNDHYYNKYKKFDIATDIRTYHPDVFNPYIVKTFSKNYTIGKL